MVDKPSRPRGRPKKNDLGLSDRQRKVLELTKFLRKNVPDKVGMPGVPDEQVMNDLVSTAIMFLYENVNFQFTLNILGYKTPLQTTYDKLSVPKTNVKEIPKYVTYTPLTSS